MTLVIDAQAPPVLYTTPRVHETVMMKRAEDQSDLNANEAYAFLRVLAPKLEQLRAGLAASNEHLKDPGAPDARLSAIIEAQLAVKEFLSGLANFSPLIEPIDILLGLLNEDTVDAPAVPEPPLEPRQPEPPPAPASASPANPRAKAAVSPDAWLRIGTLSAVDRLIAAGMAAQYAGEHVAGLYAKIGLTLSGGAPVTGETIKHWSGPGGWRKKSALKPRGGAQPARGPAAMLQAQARVAELANLFKKMSAAANG